MRTRAASHWRHDHERSGFPAERRHGRISRQNRAVLRGLDHRHPHRRHSGEHPRGLRLHHQGIHSVLRSSGRDGREAVSWPAPCHCPGGLLQRHRGFRTRLPAGRRFPLGNAVLDDRFQRQYRHQYHYFPAGLRPRQSVLPGNRPDPDLSPAENAGLSGHRRGAEQLYLPRRPVPGVFPAVPWGNPE